MFIAMQANTMMVEPIWKNVNDPRAEAFSNVEVMRQHLMLYLNNVDVTPTTASILWSAYKSAGNTLCGGLVLRKLSEVYETDNALGLALLESQCDNFQLKSGYDEATVGDALSLINDKNSIPFNVMKTLKQDGWLD